MVLTLTWTEALQLMKESAKWQLSIPPDLAYGEHGTLVDKTLIFDVELISAQIISINWVQMDIDSRSQKKIQQEHQSHADGRFQWNKTQE